MLLTSSWAIARCVQHARAARFDAARRFALTTVGLGVVFFALKIAEWVHLIRDGHTFTSSDFMQHFFFLTSIHAIHLVIGFVALGVLVYQLSDPHRRSAADDRDVLDLLAHRRPVLGRHLRPALRREVNVKLSAERRLAVAWIVVVALTVIYLVIDGSADDHGIPRASTVASVAAIVLALVKLRIIMREFMDVRHAPPVLRRMTDVLVVVMAVSLLGSYLVGRAIA